jgi:hypothetical protein
MSNVASVITTTTNTAVDSANSAVSIGRWSNLASIAFSFHTFTRRSSWLRNDCTILPEEGQRIVPMYDLLLAQID